jgi:hypothetical protein
MVPGNRLNHRLQLMHLFRKIPDVQLKSAHPAGSELQPPAPSPVLEEGEQECLKVPLPIWERDLG